MVNLDKMITRSQCSFHFILSPSLCSTKTIRSVNGRGNAYSWIPFVWRQPGSRGCHGDPSFTSLQPCWHVNLFLEGEWEKKEEEDGRIREGEDMRTSKNVWKQNPIFDNFYGDRMTRARPKPSQNTHSTDLIGWSNYFEMCLFFQLITITAYVMA